MKKILLMIPLLISLSAYSQNPPNLKLSDPLPANLFIELAKSVNPSIVFISTTVLPKRRGRGQQDPFYDMLEQFWGVPLQPSTPQPAHALGTGFIIRKDGHIITNNHVIDGADSIQIQLKDRPKEVFEAKVLGRDARTDLALLKITAKFDLPVVPLGNSKDLQVGEWVAAFGNPFGHSFTMTKGIISAIGREIPELNRLPFIQTDASINQGNSGGPLVNTRGEVIGVNSAIDARAQGIGFAIPIDDVKRIIVQLESKGRVDRAFLGVALADIDPRAAQSLGLKSTDGAIVMQVEKGSPADKAGIEPYDVILEFNDKKIADPMTLTNAVGDANIGSSAKLKVLREGKQKSIDVKLIARNDDSSSPRGAKEMKGQKAPFDLGFEVAEITEEKNLGVDESLIGYPVVVQVLPNSPASAAGLYPGDVILDANRQKTPRVSNLLKTLRKGSNILRVLRQGGPRLIIIDNK